MKRVLRIATVVLAIAALTLLLLFFRACWHWFEIHTGTARGGPDPYYNFWSGFGSDMGEYAIASSLIVGIVAAYRRHQCQEPTCWWLGKHPTHDGTFILCRRHHPDLAHTDGRKFTLDEIHALHHRRRREAGLSDYVHPAEDLLHHHTNEESSP